MSNRPSQEAGPSNTESGVGALLANKLPSIRILRPPPSKGSPKVDERCFTYCSQSIGGRINGAEPWCRTVCLRKVFEHEMKRHYMSYDPSDPEAVKTVDMKYPLPPEGQKTLRFFPWVSVADHPPRTNNDGTVNNSTPVRESSSSDRQTRYWEEGWYMWMSKSRWGAQEKLDLMLQDLEAQTEWYEYKAKAQAAWNKKQEHPQSPSHPGRNPSVPSPSVPSSSQPTSPTSGPPSGTSRQETRTPPVAELVHHPENEMMLPPPDHVADSLLIHLPPPIEPPFEKALGPAQRVLSKTWKSIEDGHQAKLIGRIAEKAITPEPFILAQNVCKKAWELWTQSSGGNEEDK